MLGRGNTGVAIAANEDAVMFNPAGLAEGKGIFKKLVVASPMLEGSASARDLAKQLSAGTSDTTSALLDRIGEPQHIGFNNFTGILLRRAAIGVFASANANLLVAKSVADGGLEAVDVDASEHIGMTFSLAESFLGGALLLGATGKYVQKAQAEGHLGVTDIDTIGDLQTSDLYGTGRGAGGDIGMQIRSPKPGRVNPAFGLTVQNVGGTRIVPESGAAVDDMEQQVNIGFAVQPGTKLSHFKLLADYWDVLGKVEPNWRKRTHFGGELSLLGFVGMTGGLSEGYASAGFYVDVRVLRLDVGGYTAEVGDRVGTRPDRRYFFRLAAGF